MRDKLYKTHKKAAFYRVRSGLLLAFFLLVGAAALTLPYRYVVQAINAYQGKKESEQQELVSETLTVSEETL